MIEADKKPAVDDTAQDKQCNNGAADAGKPAQRKMQRHGFGPRSRAHRQYSEDNQRTDPNTRREQMHDVADLVHHAVGFVLRAVAEPREAAEQHAAEHSLRRPKSSALGVAP